MLRLTSPARNSNLIKSDRRKLLEVLARNDAGLCPISNQLTNRQFVDRPDPDLSRATRTQCPACRQHRSYSDIISISVLVWHFSENGTLLVLMK